MIESKGQGKCPLEIGCKLTIYGTSPQIQSQQLLMMVCQAIWGLRPPTAMLILGVAPIEKITPGWWLKINPHLWNGKNIVRLV